MQQATPTNVPTIGETAEQATGLTGALLAGGIIAGPLYLVSGFTQAFTRPEFDITRHPFSILSSGPLGFIQISTFLLCGLLVVGAAVGLRRALRKGRGRTWAPSLLGLYRLGLIGAGIFRAERTPLDVCSAVWR